MNNENQEGQSRTPLGERIENLVTALEKAEKTIEKRFSFRYAFVRGLMQGLGIVIGSTILAGILYATLVHFVSPQTIQKWTLDAVIERTK